MISSTQHPKVKHWVKVRTQRRYRREQGRVILVGSKLVRELCRARRPLTLILTESTPLPEGIDPMETVAVSESVMKKVTGVQSPEGIAAEVEVPELAIPTDCHRLLILDGLQDPGNLGTLLRTALAFDWMEYSW